LIKLIIIGFGNLAKSFVKILSNLKKGHKRAVLFPKIGPYELTDMSIVNIFDIQKSLVEKSLIEIIPNLHDLCRDIKILPGVLLDPIPKMLSRKIITKIVDSSSFERSLNNIDADIAILAINSFARKSALFYAQKLAAKGISLINATPIKIACEREIVEMFRKNNAIIVGDYIRGYFDPWVFKLILRDVIDWLGLSVSEFHEMEFIGGVEGGSLIEPETRRQMLSKLRDVISNIYSAAESVSSSYDWQYFLKNFRSYQSIIHIKDPLENLIEMHVHLRWSSSHSSALLLFDVIRAVKLALDKGYCGRVDEICNYGFLFNTKKFSIKPFSAILDDFKQFITSLSLQ